MSEMGLRRTQPAFLKFSATDVAPRVCSHKSKTTWVALSEWGIDKLSTKDSIPYLHIGVQVQRKAPLKPHELAKKGGQYRMMQNQDLQHMVNMAQLVDADPDLGFDDARETLDQIKHKLRLEIFKPTTYRPVDPNHIDSLLWACNMLDEAGRFSHPDGLTFDGWVNKMFSLAKFDKTYNMMIWKERNTDGR